MFGSVFKCARRVLVVREKAKNMVALLKDDERLKDERQRAMQAKERQGGIGSDGSGVGASKSPSSKR